MPRELMLLRHGKSDWNAGAANDFARPLAKRGHKAVERMGKWLRASGLRPDLVVSSPAERTRETALRVCRAAGVEADLLTFEPAIYEGGVVQLLGVLASCPVYKTRVMLIGHNPGLEDLVLYLSGGDARRGAGEKLMPTAALAHLTMPDDWNDLAAGAAHGCEITRPRDLDDG